MKVKLLPFDEVFADESSGNIKTPQSEYQVSGRFPVVDQGKALIAGYVDDELRVCGRGRPAIVFGDHTRCVKYVDQPFCMGADGVKILRPKIDADLKYLYYYLRQLKLPDGGYDRHFKYLKRAYINVVSLNEQRRIAAILDKADALRAKRREVLDCYDALEEAIFMEMFGDPEKNSKKLPTARLQDLCTRITDGTHQSPQWKTYGIPFLFISNIVDGDICYNTNKFISAEDYSELTRRCPIDVGDVLYTTVGSYGNVAVVREQKRFCFQRHIAQIKPNLTKLDSLFCAGMLRSSGVRKQVDRVVRGVAQKTINLSDLKNLQVFEPTMELQKDYASKLKHLAMVRDRQRQAVRHADQLFSSLQHRAFNGDL